MSNQRFKSATSTLDDILETLQTGEARIEAARAKAISESDSKPRRHTAAIETTAPSKPAASTDEDSSLFISLIDSYVESGTQTRDSSSLKRTFRSASTPAKLNSEPGEEPYEPISFARPEYRDSSSSEESQAVDDQRESSTPSIMSILNKVRSIIPSKTAQSRLPRSSSESSLRSVATGSFMTSSRPSNLSSAVPPSIASTRSGRPSNASEFPSNRPPTSPKPSSGFDKSLSEQLLLASKNKDLNRATKLLYGHIKSLNIGSSQTIDVSYSRDNGITALHWAMVHRDVNMVTLLLEHGADWTKKANGGLSPQDIAEKNDELRQLIMEFKLKRKRANSRAAILNAGLNAR